MRKAATPFRRTASSPANIRSASARSAMTSMPDQGNRGGREDHHGQRQAQEDQEPYEPAQQRRVDDEHPRYRRAEGDAAQLHWLSHAGTHHALDARFRRVDARDFAHDGLWRRESADQAAADVG